MGSHNKAHNMTTERSYIMIKPDGVQRGLVGEIIKRFEAKGFKLVGLRMTQPSKELLEKHYADLKDRPFFPTLLKYMLSGPVVCMAWEGKGVVKTGRVMLGETDPAKSAPGTIRGDYCIDVSHNVCHGSDSVESATRKLVCGSQKVVLNGSRLKILGFTIPNKLIFSQ